MTYVDSDVQKKSGRHLHTRAKRMLGLATSSDPLPVCPEPLVQHLVVRGLEASVDGAAKLKDVKDIYVKVSLGGNHVNTMAKQLPASGRLRWQEKLLVCRLDLGNGKFFGLSGDPESLRLALYECRSLKGDRLLSEAALAPGAIPVIDSNDSGEPSGRWYYGDGSCSEVHRPQNGSGIFAVLYFDLAYKMPQKLPMGKLSVNYIRAELDQAKHECWPVAVLRYNHEWAKAPASPQANRLHVKDWQFDILDPAATLSIALFDSISHGSQHRHHFLGAVRVRTSVLPIGQDVRVEQPLYVRKYHFNVQVSLEVVGKIEICVRREHSDKRRLFEAYLQPLLPVRCYGPDYHRHSAAIRTQKNALLQAYLAQSPVSIEPDMAEVVLDSGGDHFAFDEAQANLKRLLDAVDVVMRARQAVIRVLRWHSAPHSLLANVLWVWLVYDTIAATATVLAGFLVYLVYQRAVRKPPVEDLITMDPTLFEFSHGDSNARPDDGSGPPGLEGPNEGEDDRAIQKGFSHLLKSWKPRDVIRARAAPVLEGSTKAQSTFASFATFIERLVALVQWHDPTATAMLLAACTAALLWLVLLPATVQPALAAGGLYVMRHPRLRSKQPPKLVNFMAHLPCRQDRVVPDNAD